MLELTANDCIISVMCGRTGLTDMAELGCSPMWVTNEAVLCGLEGIRVGEVIISVTLCETVLDRTPEVSPFPGWASLGSVVSGSLEETYGVEATDEFFVLELVMSDGTISVKPDETGLVDMAELGRSPVLATNGIVVYGSEVIKVDEVIVSGMRGEMVLNRTPEVPCLPLSVTPVSVASGCIKDKPVFEVTAWLSVLEILT